MATREEIAFKVSMATGYRQIVVQEIIDMVLMSIEEEVSRGNEVKFQDFGTFERKHMNERIGRNPHTGEAVPIEARNVPNFKPSKRFRNLVLETSREVTACI